MKIDDFKKDETSFLSNFFIDEKGFCAELHYQAAKFQDEEDRNKILKMKPGESKRYANAAINKARIRKNFYNVKLKIMETILEEKFKNPSLRERLLKTDECELIEGNYWHDNFWGSCYCTKCGDIGENNLGKILMRIRELCERGEI